MKTANEKTVSVTLSRRQLCDLMLACRWVCMEIRLKDGEGQRWEDLHARLAEVLRNHDKNGGGSI